MQLLGVVNQPPPTFMAAGEEGEAPYEEVHAHLLNVCAGVEVTGDYL